MKYRDNAVDSLGKRSLSWHVTLVFYSVQVYVDPDVYDIRQGIMYIDHINALNNKEDTTCVISLIEDILKFIKMILPKHN